MAHLTCFSNHSCQSEIGTEKYTLQFVNAAKRCLFTISEAKECIFGRSISD